MRPGYRVIDHTADVAIEAQSGDLATLFDRCAAGMFSLISEKTAHRAGDERILVERQAHDLPELLVAWLRELLWLHADRGFVYNDARFETLGDRHLRALVRGVVPSPVHVRELKAVTYHDLVVERRATGWYARVVFDV